MRFIRIISLLLLAAIIYSSCSSSFNPAAPYKNITVVYGLLSLSDTVHYIKIEKAFLSENSGNAYTEAQVADSLYYPEEDLSVSLQASQNGSNVGSPIPLTYVDGSTIGLNKDTGVFATNPNIVYYTRQALNENYTYTLYVMNSKTGVITSSQTVLVNNFQILNPYPNANFRINFMSGNYFNCLWNDAVNGAIYQLIIRFHYKEMNILNKADSSQHILSWVFPPQPSSGGTTDNLYINGSSFYTFVASQVAVNSAVERQAESFDFWFYAGGQTLYTYEQVSIANSTSLVYGQTNPSYTDITNGIGVFSSTLFQPDNGFLVAFATMDSLSRSSVTNQLNFLDASGNLYSK